MAPQLFINYKVCYVTWIFMSVVITILLADGAEWSVSSFRSLLFVFWRRCCWLSPRLVLDQLKSVSHLQGTVLMYRVSAAISQWIWLALLFCQIKQPPDYFNFASSPLFHQGINTLISDLCTCASFFSSTGSFSSSHQLSCFRDELLFLLYLYQRRYTV